MVRSKLSLTCVLFPLCVVASPLVFPPSEFTNCTRVWKKVGCYNDFIQSKRALTDQLVNNRDVYSHVFKAPRLDWNRVHQSFHSLACQCAEIVLARGFKVFGLQFYGECWSGDGGENTFDQFNAAPQENCVMDLNYQDQTISWQGCDMESEKECIGVGRTNFVYKLAIDGGFTPWMPDGECSDICGGGVQRFVRSCTNPSPQYGGQDCVGPTEKTEMCNQFECPTSCREIYQSNSGKENKAYLLQMDTGKVPVYCHITAAGIGGACGGGGWTLVMKIDGRKRTFHYDSSYWSNRNVYDPSKGETGFDEQETKLPTYWNTPFTKICLGMKMPGQGEIRFIQVPLQTSKSSLYQLIADGQYRPTFLGRNAWKTLLGHQGSLQLNCNREGFNVKSGIHRFSRVRIGYMANQEHDCLTSDSRVGFGAGGLTDDSNTCGNEARYSGDNGDKHIKAMGYILVQ